MTSTTRTTLARAHLDLALELASVGQLFVYPDDKVSEPIVLRHGGRAA
jgi:hypothetical protein